MKAITYRIHLLEPALVTSLDGDPNSAVAHPFLPGSVLRGLLIEKYVGWNKIHWKDFSAADPDIRQLFFDGSTRFLNAYPVDRQERRMLPCPLSLFSKKGESEPVYDMAHHSQDEKSWILQPELFCTLTADGEIQLMSPLRQVSIHIARERKGTRPVYRYDALASDQKFEAVILCEEAKVSKLVPFLAGETVLGGSRTGGYGRASIYMVREKDQNWREAHIPFRSSDSLIVTLLSDAILRDENGQHIVDASLFSRALSLELGVSLQLKQSFLRARFVGGFNRKWGLPLPQTPAFAMGSAFVFDSPQCSESSLLELEHGGIGERRTEGFGRLVFNWNFIEEFTVVRIEKPEAHGLSDHLSPGSPAEKMARKMAERLLRRDMDAALLRTVLDTDLKMSRNRPTNHQISRLRLLLQNAMADAPEDGVKRVKDFLEDVGKRQATNRQYEKELLKWLKERLNYDSHEIWNKMRVSPILNLGPVKMEADRAMRYEYNLRLADGVLAYEIKNRKQAKRKK